jgi:hypothetical protein
MAEITSEPYCSTYVLFEQGANLIARGGLKGTAKAKMRLALIILCILLIRSNSSNPHLFVEPNFNPHICGNQVL